MPDGPVVFVAPWLLQIYLATADACAAAGCQCCAREAEHYRALLALAKASAPIVVDET